jgi:adenosine deaminase
MKYFVIVVFTFRISVGFAQNIETHFEKIRNNTALVTAFFAQMPKGGDLHHHYNGSVYAETFLDYAVEHDFYINKNALEISETNKQGWTSFSTLKNEGSLDYYKDLLIRKWSVKDYDPTKTPSHKQFFDSFDFFDITVKGTYEKGLLEIKNRAKRENVSYIETMFAFIPCNKNLTDLEKFNHSLRAAQKKTNEASAMSTLDSLYKEITSRDVKSCATDFNTGIVSKYHNTLGIDDAEFTMRYQNFVLRFFEPVTLFKDLIAAFESANTNPLIAGVNIVSPEHGEVAMRDYWLHMLMFKYCHAKYPNIKYSLHAGELVLGLAKPEDLTFHIHDAVFTAGANRIGHGVDMPYEKNSTTLLKYMSKNNIPIEINLYSNEFILGVKNDKHPISLYKQSNVPIVISSDDAGILRTSLTEQYVLLAKRYPEISYPEIKQYVYNSLKFSFIQDEKVKSQLVKNLDQRFSIFEKSILAEMK